MIRVLIADDHAAIRFGLGALIDAEPDLEIVGSAQDGLDAITMSRRLAPDVLIIDLSMPVLDGIAALRVIVRQRPTIRVLVLTLSCAEPNIREALAAGADGYLLKDSPSTLVVSAVRAVYQGENPMSPAVEMVLGR